MKKLLENTIEDYLHCAASGKPAPGGGSVSALAGALGCAMGEMAANFTVGKAKFADVQDDIKESLDDLKAAREKLESLIDEDAEAYKAVVEAQALPKGTPEQKECREQTLQAALNEAMIVPLNIMRQCAVFSRRSVVLALKANPYLLTDVGVCAILAEAACTAAKLSVEINLKYLKNFRIERNVRMEVDELCRVTDSGRKRVLEKVYEILKG